MTRLALRRVGVAAVPALFIAAAVGGSNVTPARATAPRCTVGRTVVASTEARVFRINNLVAGCVRGQRRAKSLIELDACLTGCRPLRPTLGGVWFAYFAVQGDGRDHSVGYEIVIVNLATRGNHLTDSVPAGSALPGDPKTSTTGRGPVVAIRLTRIGSVVFAVKDVITPAAGYRIYSARRSDASADGVWTPVELGSGKDITPSSLRLDGDLASWIQGRQRRVVPLR